MAAVSDASSDIAVASRAPAPTVAGSCVDSDIRASGQG